MKETPEPRSGFRPGEASQRLPLRYDRSVTAIDSWRPRVSVLIDTYNHERYIEQAISSALEQDFPAADTEILVVDDGSTDRTPEIARQFEPRVRVLRKANGGQVSAFNAGLAELHGDVVAFLDGDDWWAKDKLSRVVRAFDENPGVAAVGHGYYDVYDSAPAAIVAPERTLRVDLSSEDAARVAESASTLLVTSRLSVRRAVLERIGALPPEAVFFDTLVFSLSFALGGALLLPEPLCYYRHHEGSLHNPLQIDAATQRRRLQALDFRLRYLPSRLLEFGVSPGVVDAFLESRRLEAARMKLVLDGGAPWETFRVESAIARASYRNPTGAYRVFKSFTLLLTLLMPPRRFYRLRDWYAARGLRRWREKIGGASDAVEPVLRKPQDL